MLTIENLSVQYSKSFSVFSNLNLSIKQNESIAIWGPNGCGKSTLVSVLAQLLPAYQGKIRFQNEPLCQSHLRNIAFIFDQPSFPKFLFVREIISIFTSWYVHKVPLQEERELINLCGLNDINHRFFKLSRGMKQRLAILIALLKRPRLLICDEAFNSIDEHHKKRITAFFRSKIMRKEISILFISHNRDECSSVADQLVCFEDLCKEQNGR